MSPQKGGSLHQAPPIHRWMPPSLGFNCKARNLRSIPGRTPCQAGWAMLKFFRVTCMAQAQPQAFPLPTQGESIQSKLIHNMANTISNLNGTPQATQPERDGLPLSDGGTSESGIYEQRMTRWVPHDFVLVWKPKFYKWFLIDSECFEWPQHTCWLWEAQSASSWAGLLKARAFTLASGTKTVGAFLERAPRKRMAGKNMFALQVCQKLRLWVTSSFKCRVCYTPQRLRASKPRAVSKTWRTWVQLLG